MADNKVSARNSPKKTETLGQNDDESSEGEEIFEVEKIIGKSKLKGKVIYKVRWKGYGLADDTWEPADNLDSCQDLIEEYVAKQSELAKKRAEEKRTKRAIMERGESNQSTTEDADSDAAYPPNFKNTFWKELEAGRVNLFDTDMYSKVKKRATTQSPSDPSPTPSPTDPNKQKKKRTQSDPEVKTSKPKLKEKSKSASKLQNFSAESSDSKEKSAKSSANVDSKVITSTPEVSSENEGLTETTELFSIETDSSDSETELMKPALNIVIRKVPSFTDSTDGMCSEDSETVTYSVVQRSPCEVGRKENVAISETGEFSGSYKNCSSGESSRIDNSDARLLKREKKKKQHKHHKHKSKHGSRSDYRDSHRKRKVEKTSLSNLEPCTSKGTSQKVPKLDSSKTDTLTDHVIHETEVKLELESEDVFFNEKILGHTELVTEVNHEQASACVDNQLDKTVNYSEICATIQEDFASSSSPSASSSSSSASPAQSIDSLSVASPSPSCSNDLSAVNIVNMNDSCDRSHPPNTHYMTDNIGTLCLSDSVTVKHEVSTNNANDSESVPTIKTEIQRRDSETVDSGIASPASDKSLTMSRQELMQPLDDLFGQTVLPLLPDNDQTQTRGADHELDIDLDEMDWGLFDKDVKLVKLDSITLTNGEFARAVIMGDYELVQQSVTGDKKYDLEQPDATGKTLLMCAVHSMYDDIVELLIEHGANIDATTKTGVTALMIACQHGEIGIVNLLLERGAKVNPQCATGETALIIAVKRGQSQILWLLLECGANFNQLSGSGSPILGDLSALQNRDTDGILAQHIHRVMSEFERQVNITLNHSASVISPIFPAQVFNLCEAEKFQVRFDYNMHLHNPGCGYLLFVGHAIFTSQEVRCRFYGPCAVQAAALNGQILSPLTQEGNFVLSFSPLIPGKNVLNLNTVRVPEGKAKLIVCAYKTQYLGGR